ncbi:MAG TPA: ATP-binding protein [Rhodocyclaceae bacterium]|nr:ATP-binding protein [Rhodocyclaceae bacterium]
MTVAHASSPTSLRWRLLRWVTLVTILIWVIAAVLSYRQAKVEIQELMDGQMAKTARFLLAQVGHNNEAVRHIPENLDKLRGAEDDDSEVTLEYQVGDASGALLLRSPNAPTTPLNTPLGYQNIRHEGQRWRSLILETEDGKYRAQVAHSIHQRNNEAFEIARKTVLPLALLLPLLIPLIYLSVRRGLQPLDDLASEVATRTPDNLKAITPPIALQETQPLVLALNRLLGRLDATLENERRFTADAAHELRTPLAALKIHAQVAMATTQPEQREHALAQVIAGADRTTRLVEQLLRLARIDPLQTLPHPQTIALDALARQAVDDARPAAAGKQQNLVLDATTVPLPVSGDPDLLGAALRNLIDNALRYTPERGDITVLTGSRDGKPSLSVSDNGPGVPAEDLPHLSERFYRGRDVDSEGNGLGLAIVRRIAELHGARLEVENREAGGFTATLRWYA